LTTAWVVAVIDHIALFHSFAALVATVYSADFIKSVVFNLGVATPIGVVNHFCRGCKWIFYAHSCITFALLDF